MRLIIYITILVHINLYGIDYPEFDVIINDNHYAEDIFIHSTASSNTQFMSILNPSLEVKWYIVSLDGKGWDFKVNNNEKITYFRKPSNDYKC